MLHKVFVISLLASAATSARELDEAMSSCNTDAIVKSTSSLIQRERASSILQIARGSRAEEREHVAGKHITIDFNSSSPDVHFMGIKSLPDFNNDGKNLTLIQKNYFELHHNHTDTEAGQVKIFGFKFQSSGLVNSNTNRLWTDKPAKRNAKLVYGIMVNKIPKDRSWKYSISFAQTPPKHLKIYPADGKVHRNGSDMYITMECSHKATCKDGSINISKITFTEENAKDNDHNVGADSLKTTRLASRKLKNEIDFETIFGASHKQKNEMDFQAIFENASFGQIEKGDSEEGRENRTGNRTKADKHGDSEEGRENRTGNRTKAAKPGNRTTATVKKDFEAKFGNASLGQIQQGKVEEEEAAGPGESLTVDFTAGSPDLAILGKRAVPDYIYDGQSIRETAKNYYELSLEERARGGMVSVDRVNLFGFEPRHGGNIVNIEKDRLWTGKPNSKDAELVYGIMLTNVPRDAHWKYSIKYAKPPPMDLRVYPEDEMLARDGDNLYMTLQCLNEKACEDDSIEISKITFIAQKGPNATTAMKPPAALQVDRRDTDFGLMLGKAFQVDRKDTDFGLMLGKAFQVDRKDTDFGLMLGKAVG